MNTPAATTATNRLPSTMRNPAPSEGLECPAEVSQYLGCLGPLEQVEVEGPVVADGRDVVAVAGMKFPSRPGLQHGLDRVVVHRSRVHAEPVHVRGPYARVVNEVVLEAVGEPAHHIDVRVVERRALHDQRYRLQAANDGHVFGRLDSQIFEGLDGNRYDPDPLARGRLSPPGGRQKTIGIQASVVALERLHGVQVVLRHAVRPSQYRPEGVGQAQLDDVEALVRTVQVTPRSHVDDGHVRPVENAGRVVPEFLTDGLDDQRVRDDRRHRLRAVSQRSKYVEPAAGLDHESRRALDQPVYERGRQILGKFRALGRRRGHRAKVVAIDRKG